jgi:ABC-type nitrate/sulfonate/bicarbonate transport system substrate-binding protein
MKKRLVAVTMALTLSLAGLTGCGSDETADATEGNNSVEVEDANAEKTDSDSEEIVIRVADFQVAVFNNQFKVAYAKGWFDEAFEGQNVKVEAINFANGPAVNEAFIAGDVDIVTGIGDQPFVIGVGNGVDTEVLAGVSRQGENIGIVAKKESGIKSAVDLKGKRIGVFLGTSVQKSLIGILDDAGLSEEDVDIVNITSSEDANAAFASDDIDAYANTLAAFLKQNADSNDFVKVADCSEHPSYSYLVASKSFVDEHREIVKTFIETLYRAEQWIAENEEESYEILAEISEQDVDYVKDSIEGAQGTIKLDDDWIENFSITYDFLKNHDLITVEVTDEDIQNHIDTSILEEVLAE